MMITICISLNDEPKSKDAAALELLDCKLVSKLKDCHKSYSRRQTQCHELLVRWYHRIGKPCRGSGCHSHTLHAAIVFLAFLFWEK